MSFFNASFSNAPFQAFSDDPTNIQSINSSYSNHEQIKITYPTIIFNSNCPTYLIITKSQSPQKYAIVCTFFGGITFLYLLLIIFMYGLEGFIFNVGLGPSANTLNTFGICNPSMIVYNGEWWRLFTSIFLSSNLLQVLINFFILLKICGEGEKRIGSNLTIIIMFISSIGGNISGAFLMPDQVSCSSSVPVCGLLGSMIVQSSLSR